MEAKGRTWLKVTGIIFIVIGGLQFLYTVLLDILGMRFLPVERLPDIELITTAAGICCILSLGAGVFGVRYSSRPEKARICFLTGMFVLFINLALAAFNVFYLVHHAKAATIVYAFASMIGLALPVLYIIGARKNLQDIDED